VSAALDLSRELIARRSVTPEDAGCQALLATRLAKAGFRCEDASVNGVSNLWARRGSGGLADDAIVDALAALLQALDDAHRAVHGRAFLVGGDQQGDGARVSGPLGDELLHRHDERRDGGLHVGGAASVQPAVAHGRHEGVGVPLLEGAGRHHVGVAREAEQRPSAAAPRPQIGDAAHAGVLALKAGLGEALGQQRLATRVGGRDGPAGDQLPGKFEG